MTSNLWGESLARSLWALQVAALELRLDPLSGTEEVPSIAAEALADGADSPTLRILAGMSRNADNNDVKDALASVADEVGFANGSREDNARSLAGLVALMIVAAAVSPIEGARTIWTRAFWQLSDRDQPCYGWAVSLCDDWDAHPERRSEIENLIVESASVVCVKRFPDN